MYVKYNMHLNLRYLLYRNVTCDGIVHATEGRLFNRITAQCCFACASAALCCRARSSPFAAAAAAARDACTAMARHSYVSLCRYYMRISCRCKIIAFRIQRSDSFESIRLL